MGREPEMRQEAGKPHNRLPQVHRARSKLHQAAPVANEPSLSSDGSGISAWSTPK
ncbi:hypothetical protein EFR01_57690 [Sinorhizobium fredii]|nr:hypothetical protein EFR01_57690 [Sinorhizobium fredii]GLS07183.1 hypothetical protein GCM10007864_08090 [Sinorhizobium fredii]